MRVLHVTLTAAQMRSMHNEAVKASFSVKGKPARLSKAEQSVAFKFGVGAELEMLGKQIHTA